MKESLSLPENRLSLLVLNIIGYLAVLQVYVLPLLSVNGIADVDPLAKAAYTSMFVEFIAFFGAFFIIARKKESDQKLLVPLLVLILITFSISLKESNYWITLIFIISLVTKSYSITTENINYTLKLLLAKFVIFVFWVLTPLLVFLPVAFITLNFGYTIPTYEGEPLHGLLVMIGFYSSLLILDILLYLRKLPWLTNLLNDERMRA